MEVEAEVKAEVVEGVGEVEIAVAIVVEIAHRRATHIVATVGPDEAGTEDEVEVEPADAAPNLVGGEAFALLILIAQERRAAEGDEPTSMRHEVIGIAERKADLPIVDGGKSEFVHQSRLGVELLQDAFGPGGIEGDALAVVAHAHEPRACAAELHSGHGHGGGIGEMVVVEDVVEVDGGGVAGHRFKADVGKTVFVDAFKSGSTDEVEVALGAGVAEVEAQFGGIGRGAEVEGVTTVAVGHETEGVAQGDAQPPTVGAEAHGVDGGEGENLSPAVSIASGDADALQEVEVVEHEHAVVAVARDVGGVEGFEIAAHIGDEVEEEVLARSRPSEAALFGDVSPAVGLCLPMGQQAVARKSVGEPAAAKAVAAETVVAESVGISNHTERLAVEPLSMILLCCVLFSPCRERTEEGEHNEEKLHWISGRVWR